MLVSTPYIFIANGYFKIWTEFVRPFVVGMILDSTQFKLRHSEKQSTS